MSSKAGRGDRVFITLKTLEAFEGVIDNRSEQLVELIEVYDCVNNVNYGGSMTFHVNEIKSISKIKEGTSETREETPGQVSGVSSTLNEARIKLDAKEFERLKEMTLNPILINQFGKSFDDAVKVLHDRESVGVAGLGWNVNGGESLDLLIMCDFNQIYIFDLKCLGELRGLQQIFEANYIVKVVHDGVALYDCLKHRYKTEMFNIFDTKIVDSKLSKDRHGEDVSRDLSECLAHHFNFPSGLLAAVMEEINSKIWGERPLIKNNKLKASKLVPYLLTLRDHLMSLILEDYNATIMNKYKHRPNKNPLSLNMNFKLQNKK